MPSGFPTASVQIVFAANVTALAVAAIFRWDLGDLLTLYWIELIAAGAIAILQMRRASRPGTLEKSHGYLLIFFVAHYSTFCVIYRAGLVSALGGDLAGDSSYWLVVWMPLAALIVAHGVSYRRDYLPREASATSRFGAMWIPYLRELPVFVPMLIAAALSSAESRTGWAVLIFGGGKTVVDAAAHIIYHTKMAADPRGRSA